MFDQPSSSIPLPRSFASSSSATSKGLYGNQLKALDPKSAGIIGLGGVGKRVERGGMIGNRIPSASAERGVGGVVPGPQTPSTGSQTPPPSSPSPPPPTSSSTEEPSPSSLPTLTPSTDPTSATDPSRPTTPLSTLTNPRNSPPPSLSLSLAPSESGSSLSRPESRMSDRSFAVSQVTDTSVQAQPGGFLAPGQEQGETDVVSGEEGEKLHDVSGVSTPMGTPRIVRRELGDEGLEMEAGTPVVDGEVEAVGGLGLGLGLAGQSLPEELEEKLKLAQDEASTPLTDVEDLTTRYMGPEETPAVGKVALPVHPAELEVGGVPEKESAGSVQVEEAEETVPAVVADKEAAGIVDAEVPVKLETKEEAEMIEEGAAAKGQEEEPESETRKEEVVGEAKETEQVDEVDKTNTDSNAEGTSHGVEGLGGAEQKQVAEEPLADEPKAVVEGKAKQDEETRIDTETEAPRKPSMIHHVSSAEDFPTVPTSLPDPVSESAGDDLPSGAATPITSAFLQSFPAVPTSDQTISDGIPDVSSPEGKVRVEVSIPTHPKSPPGSAVDRVRAEGSMSPEMPMRRSGSFGPRSVLEDALDDGEGGWAKVVINKDRY